MLTHEQVRVSTLGECRVPSPLAEVRRGPRKFVPDAARVLLRIEYDGETQADPLGFEKAGPREQIYFEPQACRAAIVTCGGLCPGLNNVIRNVFYSLTATYGVPQVLGIRDGYKGLNPKEGLPPVYLTSSMVGSIHHHGGTMLGTSRGPQDPVATVDFLQQLGVNMLFAVGGDGTQKGAHAIAQEALRRDAQIAVVGIPKTIDNDIRYCYRTFGFLSAVEEAERVIDRAHVEAVSVDRGVGLVKLMGREAGFIAAAATIASGEVNFTLIPEDPFELEGPHGLLAKLEKRLAARGHAVVVVAEGAGQHLLTQHEHKTDPSGNRKLADIGVFLKEQIELYFKLDGRKAVSLKYFDPSYYIRSAHANAADSLLCEQFSRAAVHAAMAGKTDVLIGYWHNREVLVPLAVSCGQIKRLETDREMWAAVLATTGQERW